MKFIDIASLNNTQLYTLYTSAGDSKWSLIGNGYLHKQHKHVLELKFLDKIERPGRSLVCYDLLWGLRNSIE